MINFFGKKIQLLIEGFLSGKGRIKRKPITTKKNEKLSKGWALPMTCLLEWVQQEKIIQI